MSLTQALALLAKPLNELTDIDLILNIISSAPDLKTENPEVHDSLEWLLKALLEIDSLYQILLKAHKKPPMDYYETNKDLANFLQKAVELSNNVPRESREFLVKQLEGLETLKRKSRDFLKDPRIKGLYDYLEEYLWKIRSEDIIGEFSQQLSVCENIDCESLREKTNELLVFSEQQNFKNNELIRELKSLIEKTQFLDSCALILKAPISDCEEYRALLERGKSMNFDPESRLMRMISKKLDFLSLLRNYSRKHILASFSGFNEETLDFEKVFSLSQEKKLEFGEISRFLREKKSGKDENEGSDSEMIGRLEQDMKELESLEIAFQALKSEFTLEKQLFSSAEAQASNCRTRLKTLFFSVIQDSPIFKSDFFLSISYFYIEFGCKDLLYSPQKRPKGLWEQWYETTRSTGESFSELKLEDFYRNFVSELEASKRMYREFEEITKNGEKKRSLDDIKKLLSDFQKKNIDFSGEAAVLQRFLNKAMGLQKEWEEKIVKKFEKVKIQDAKLLYSKLMAFPISFNKEIEALEKELSFINEIKPIVKEFEQKPWNLSSILTKYKEHAIEIPEIESLIAKNAEISNRGLKIEAMIQELEMNQDSMKFEDYLRVFEEFEALNLNKNPEISAFRKSLKRRLFLLKVSFISRAIHSQTSNILRIPYKVLQKDLETGYSLIKREKNREELSCALRLLEDSLDRAEKLFKEAEERKKNLDNDLLIRNFLDVSEEILQFKAALGYHPDSARVNYKSNNLHLAQKILTEKGFEEVVRALEKRKRNFIEENQEIIRERTKNVRMLSQVLMKFQLSEQNNAFFAKKIEEVLFTSKGTYQVKIKKICEILIFMASGLKKVAKEFRRRGFDKETLLRLVELDDLKLIPDLVVGKHMKPGKKRGRKPKNYVPEEPLPPPPPVLPKPIQKGKKRGRKPKNLLPEPIILETFPVANRGIMVKSREIAPVITSNKVEFASKEKETVKPSGTITGLKRLRKFREDTLPELEPNSSSDNRGLARQNLKTTTKPIPLEKPQKASARNVDRASEKEKELSKLFVTKRAKENGSSLKQLETLLGKNANLRQKNEEKNPAVKQKPHLDAERGRKKEVIRISSSSDEDLKKSVGKPILFDPDQDPLPLRVVINTPPERTWSLGPNFFLPKVEDSPEKDPLYSLFQGRFKFNKSHAKTFIELFTTVRPQNFQIPPFPNKNPEKPKLITSGTTNIQTFVRFYFENQSTNPRDMLMGWLEALDEASDKNLEVLAEELKGRQEITGLKFGVRNSASIHFLSLNQLDQNEYLSALKKKMTVWAKKSVVIRMVFLITVNSERAEKNEEKLEFLKVLKGEEWEVKRLSEIGGEEERIRQEIENILDEEENTEEFKGDFDEDEDDRILALFGRKKRKGN